MLGLLLLSKDFRIFISSPIRSENAVRINSLDVPEFKLIIRPEVEKKFDLIYSHYTEDFFGKDFQKFVDFLDLNNNWEKAQLTYLNQTYDVKIKLHGKTPTQHVEGNHYSLGVKLLNGAQINEVSRFNLIVFWRIRYKYDVLKYLANNLDLNMTENELVKIQINDRTKKLYFFEYRMNSDFLKKTNRQNFVALKHKSDHSLVYTGGDIEKWNVKLIKAIGKLEVNDSLKAIIYDNYSKLNNAIYEENTKQVISHFDLEYLTKIQAFRYVFADDGHGFGFENLLILFNLSNGKFYPFVHRDNTQYTLSESELSNGFNGENIGTYSPLFGTLAKSDLLTSKTENYLNEILSEKRLESEVIDSIIEEYNSYYYSSSIKQFLGMQAPHSSCQNIKTLKKHFLLK
ncbi:MAG: hypothetical protein ACPGEG_07645 [Salibacteraceae bacterium]